jgi:hypothetical protein
MFKGILPAKRIPSTEFSMVTNLAEASGKENMPGGAVLPPPSKGTRQATATKGLGLGQPQDKKKRGDAKKGKVTPEPQPLDAPDMNMAFDKLLVSRVR